MVTREEESERRELGDLKENVDKQVQLLAMFGCLVVGDYTGDGFRVIIARLSVHSALRVTEL